MMIRPDNASDRDWIACTLAQRWGSTTIVARGRLCDAASLAALVAVDTTCEHEPERVGLLTYRLDREGLEVVTIDALKTGAGIGTALLSSGVRIARNAGAGRVWLITTNDNLRAISLYERKGFRVIAVHKGGSTRIEVGETGLLHLAAPSVAGRSRPLRGRPPRRSTTGSGLGIPPSCRSHGLGASGS